VLLVAPGGKWWLYITLTVTFSIFGRVMRGVTTFGALAGGIVCFALLLGAGFGGFAALVLVFLLTWAATHFGYSRKQALGAAESRAGRTANQVLANLGVAAGCAIGYAYLSHDQRLLAAMAAALAEAAADTISSEIGQAVGGAPRLITSWNLVPPGTNGAITVTGTLAGSLAAILVGAICAATNVVGWSVLPVVAGVAIAGTVVDSLLGATLEQRGILGNNVVNFLSTATAALLAHLFL
jgi:uncharacterized protein (TIGR00297 family)